MKKEDEHKKDTFLRALAALLKKFEYSVSKRKNESGEGEFDLTADITCWFTRDGKLVYTDPNEIGKYLKNVDDATNYRSNTYNNFISNVNINHIAFDASHGMKYNLKRVYEKICKMDEDAKDPLFEDVFKLCANYEGSTLTIRITTESELEDERVAMEISRGASKEECRRREFPENKVVKIYQLDVEKEENRREFQQKLYKILMKHKYYVNHISEVCDFSKWCSSKSGNNLYIMKQLKYYFDDMIDEEQKRIQLFLVHRNTPFCDFTRYDECAGMGYGKDEFIIAREVAGKEESTFYMKLFDLFIEYDIIMEIK